VIGFWLRPRLCFLHDISAKMQRRGFVMGSYYIFKKLVSGKQSMGLNSLKFSQKKLFKRQKTGFFHLFLIFNG
jgi:hypothetical protein